jgi:hypothetical protein
MQPSVQFNIDFNFFRVSMITARGRVSQLEGCFVRRIQRTTSVCSSHQIRSLCSWLEGANMSLVELFKGTQNITGRLLLVVHYLTTKYCWAITHMWT